MPKCTFRERPGDPESCNTLASPGKSLCPRHEFLQALKDQAKAEKKPSGGGMPKTRAGLIAAGYTFTSPSTCRSCNRSIEWWVTPTAKKAPYNPMPNDAAPSVSHFATCTSVGPFRKAS